MSFLDPLLLERFGLGAVSTQDLALYSASIFLVVVVAAAVGQIVFPAAGVPLLYAVLQPLGLLPATAGCRLIGVPRESSNLLRDELDPRHAAGDADGDGRTWKVKSLWIYPVKSCAGVELDRSAVVKCGLQYDRWFSFAILKKPPVRPGLSDNDDDHPPSPGWEFLTIRGAPLLANVNTQMWVPDPEAPGYSPSLPAVRSQGVVRVTFPCRRGALAGGFADALKAWFYGDAAGTASFTLPFQPPAEQIGGTGRYGLETMKIWKDFPVALNMGADVPTAELAAYLGLRQPLTMFRTHAMRELYRDAPRKDVLGWQPVAAFNDAFPINMLGLGSVRDLDARQPAGSPPLSARRFRANIILQGTPPYEEEKWKYIRIGANEYYVSARCVRCKLPNVDPDTGIKHKSEPDRTIRAERAVDLGAPKGTGCLAMQLVPKLELGTINVGDVIEVKQTGDHVYTPM